MDLKKIANLYQEILKEISEDPKREGLEKTPERIAKSFEKIFGGYKQKASEALTQFDTAVANWRDIIGKYLR